MSKKNLMEIVKKLMVHMDKAEGSHYRDELLSKIIEICSQSNYQFITNFEWYDRSLSLCVCPLICSQSNYQFITNFEWYDRFLSLCVH